MASWKVRVILGTIRVLLENHSRLVSLMFDHFVFACDAIFIFRLPIKYHDFFFVIYSVSRLVYPLLGVLCCSIRWVIRVHIFFWSYFKSVFSCGFPCLA